MHRLVVAVLALTLAGLLSACSVSSRWPSQLAPAPSSDPTAKALADFGARVDEYARLHRSVAHAVAPLEKGLDATELWAREERLADTIRVRRPWARQGNLFTASVTPVLVEIVQTFLSSVDGAAAREVIATDNPVMETPLTPVLLTVNGSYEHRASLSTMPPTLLMRLPNLPDEVEFRFVGKHLVLRDTSANIIVDYILDVAP